MRKTLATLLLSATLGLGCTSECTKETPLQKKLVYDHTDNNINRTSLEKVVDATIKIVSKRGEQSIGHGSGVGIVHKDNRTYFLTAYHVIENEKVELFGLKFPTATIHVEDYENKELQFEFGSKEHDIAVVSCEGLYPIYNKFANHNAIQMGDEVRAIGYPHFVGKFMSQGIVGRKKDDVYFLDIDLNKGNSGGPYLVFNNGEPRIMSVGKFYIKNAQGIGGVASTKVVLDLFKEHGLYGGYHES